MRTQMNWANKDDSPVACWVPYHFRDPEPKARADRSHLALRSRINAKGVPINICNRIAVQVTVNGFQINRDGTYMLSKRSRFSLEFKVLMQY
jgi:hypothetical protein